MVSRRTAGRRTCRTTEILFEANEKTVTGARFNAQGETEVDAETFAPA
jgi:hypothetical protein